MTLVITVPGADFSTSSFGRAIRLTSNRIGLIGEYILGKNKTSSVYNGANHLAPLLAVGAPIYEENYCRLSQGNWFNTASLYDSQEFSILAFCESLSPDTVIFGNFQGTNTVANTSLYKTAGNFTGLATNTSAVQNIIQSSSATTGNTAEFRALSYRTTGLVDFTMKLDQFKGGTRQGGNSITRAGLTRSVLKVTPFAIGSSRGAATFPGPVNIAGVLVWARSLSDAEMLAAYTEARAVLATRGIDS